MTIVALAYFHDSFLAISDSRISWGSGGKLEKFSKLFSHGYRFTCGRPPAKPPSTYTGEIGLAFAGSTLFGLAFSNMFARTISEMHSFDVVEPPSFGAFGKIADHCANTLCQYVLGPEQCFKVLIFGFDPRDQSARAIRLKLGPSSNGVAVASQEWKVHEDEITSIGTGAKHLPEDLPRPSQVPLSILISRVVSSNVDPTTGGDIQAMELGVDRAYLLGTMTDGKSWDDATYFGISRAELGDIDGFRVGRTEPVSLKPYSAVRQLASKKARHFKDTVGDAPKDKGNVLPMMSFLSVIHRERSPGVIDQKYQLEKSVLIAGQYYFYKVCPTCWRNSPSILSPSEGEGFQGEIQGSGSITTSCQYCNKEIAFLPSDFGKDFRWDG